MWPEQSPWPGFAACVLLALLAGMVLRNLIPATARLKPGADAMIKKWLPVGIVLLGARLDFYLFIDVAVQVLLGSAALIVGIILLTRLLSRWCGVGEKLGLMIGMGTAICGSSAIVAAAPVVEVRGEDVAYSIGIINLLGVTTMLLFPLLGPLLELDARIYGAWCGLGIHATPQVIAAGFAHPLDGHTAGETATIVKLVRISLLGPAVFMLGYWYALRKRRHAAHIGAPVKYSKLVPGFVLLFLGLALLRTVGLLPEVTLHMSERWFFGAGDVHVDVTGLLSQAGKWLITAAIAGVGLLTELRTMKGGGVQPLLVGVLASIAIAAAGLWVASL